MTLTMKMTQKIDVQSIFFALAISFISTATFCQSSEPVTNSTALKEGQKLENYVWSFMKSKADKSSKSLIDFKVMDNWRQLGDYLEVSHNGLYFAYSIDRGSATYRIPGILDSIIVQSTDNLWRRSFSQAQTGFFSPDNKQYIFRRGKALCFLKLGASECECVDDIVSCQLGENGNSGWVAYQLNNNKTTVILRNLVTKEQKRFDTVSKYDFYGSGKWLACQITDSLNGQSEELLCIQLSSGLERRFKFVTDYLFSVNGMSALLITQKKTDTNLVKALEYVHLQEGTIKTLWSSYDSNVTLKSYSMDSSGAAVAFNVEKKLDFNQNDLPKNEVWYYKDGMDNSVLKVTDETKGISEGLRLTSEVSLTSNGHFIEFSLQPKPLATDYYPQAVQLEVWNHKDLRLQSSQAYFLAQTRVYRSLIAVDNDSVMQLERNGKTLHLIQGDFAILKKYSKETHGDRFWENGFGYNKDSNWIVSLRKGSEQLLPTSGGDGTFWFSPRNKYLIFFDPHKKCHYFSYNLNTGIIKDISFNVPENHLGLIERYDITTKKPEYPKGLTAWMESESSVLVYDNNDIWRCDLNGKKPAINVTNGYGRAHNIIFNLLKTEAFAGGIKNLTENESILLTAYSTVTKCNGYYSIDLRTVRDPKLLCMGQFFGTIIPFCHDPNLSNKGMPPIKARDADIWIVQRQSTNDAPNYFETRNFKSFMKLTNWQPQSRFKWLSEELHSFEHLDGRTGQGILYKPEDFNPNKRYPVLIVIYGGYSDNLYQFPIPVYNGSAITPGSSPMWFLNNGYLVFTPDVYVAPLKYGQEALNVVEGAVRFLKHLSFVDSDKIGFCAHSWSAKLGSYVFTHSHGSINAVAISEGYGYANILNEALSADEDGTSNLGTVENEFEFGSLWRNKNSWLDQTTIINVDKVSSPLLLLCNKRSPKDYQNQTLQLFTALRRLDKNVWWLKYDKGSHALSNIGELKDYTVRYTQFFDHYLKSAPAPKWMTHGIPISLKGVDNRYELDPSGNCGQDCKICKRWNRQYQLHPEMFSKPISEWHLDK